MPCDKQYLRDYINTVDYEHRTNISLFTNYTQLASVQINLDNISPLIPNVNDAAPKWLLWVTNVKLLTFLTVYSKYIKLKSFKL